MSRPKILLVDDAVEFQMVISEALGRDLEITPVTTAEDAIEALEHTDFDLILLDIILPTRDGYSLLSELQRNPRTSQIPVMCVSSKGNLPEKVMAFNLGADDYIVKPFEMIELKARVDSKLRKQQRKEQEQNVLRCGDLELNRDTYRATIVEGHEKLDLGLSPIEFKILAFFIKNQERVLSREQILAGAWGNESKAFDRAVDVHICSLRRKLKDHSRVIKAVHGIGYQFLPLRCSKTAISH